MKFDMIKYFYPEKPVVMLIESDSFQEMSDSDEWVCEPKFNGSRCLVHMNNGYFEFWDRHGKHLAYNRDVVHIEAREKICHILRNLFGTEGYFVFDCELRHNKVEGIQNKLVIYDIHVYKNEFLNRLTFKERRDILESYFGNFEYSENVATIHLINQYKENFQRVFDDYVASHGNPIHGNPEEFEGIVIKNLNGKLNLGRSSGTNSLWMFKVRKQTGRHRY